MIMIIIISLFQENNIFSVQYLSSIWPSIKSNIKNIDIIAVQMI